MRRARVVRLSPTLSLTSCAKPHLYDLGNFSTPTGVEGLAFDSSGNLYVSDNNTGGIEKYSPSGVDLGLFAAPATYGIAFDSLENLWSGAGTGQRGEPGEAERR